MKEKIGSLVNSELKWLSSTFFHRTKLSLTTIYWQKDKIKRKRKEIKFKSGATLVFVLVNGNEGKDRFPGNSELSGFLNIFHRTVDLRSTIYQLNYNINLQWKKIKIESARYWIFSFSMKELSYSLIWETRFQEDKLPQILRNGTFSL
jgi:hypothetical protein